MFVSLSVVFLALAVHLSASSSDAVPSAIRSETTVISKRVLNKHSLLPVDVVDSSEIRDSECRQRMVTEALDFILIKSLIGIVAEYSVHHARLFAERLYDELWEGKTDLLEKELYDAEGSALKEKHDFWEYLAEEAQRVVAFVRMLQEAEEKHTDLKETLLAFARLVGAKVPAAEYFVACYIDGEMLFLLRNVSLDEWPEALSSAEEHVSKGLDSYLGVAKVVQYLLVQDSIERVASLFSSIRLDAREWCSMLYTLHAADPALLHRLFDVRLAKGSFTYKQLFERTAGPAMGMYPTLSSALVAIARRSGWEEPVAKDNGIAAEFADDAKAGGTVHMQPLTAVARSLDHGFSAPWFAASSTLKTADFGGGTKLFIAAGNELCAISSRFGSQHVYVRSFESGKVETHEIVADRPIARVQHGDVVGAGSKKQCPAFFEAQVYCRDRSRSGRFECVKAFFQAAKEPSSRLVVIVESDGLEELEKGAEGKVEEQVERDELQEA